MDFREQPSIFLFLVLGFFLIIGFDVDLGPSVQTPEEVARHAIDSDVHAVGVRNVAVNHLTLIPTLVSELKKLGRP